MAALRAIEDRDSKGATIRINPTVVYKQDFQIRKIIGRHDWRMDDNPDYHEPITAQVQNGKILFFQGIPDTASSRKMAKEISQTEVPAYIINAMKKGIKIREPRPTVYEVKLAMIGDVEVTEVSELANDGNSVTIEPVAPNLTPAQRAGKTRAAVIESNL